MCKMLIVLAWHACCLKPCSAKLNNQAQLGSQLLRNLQLCVRSRTGQKYPVRSMEVVMRTAKELPHEEFSSNCDTIADCDAVIEVADIIAHGPLSGPPGGNLWTILLLVTSAVNVGLILSYQLFIILSPARTTNTRKQVFLSQALLLGLLLGSALGFAYSLEPSPASCVAIRLGTGLVYVLIYSSIMIKQVFLISLNTGVYLPVMYQILLFFFCILVQIVISIQWLVLVPLCQFDAQQHIFHLFYIFFLNFFITFLSIKSFHIKENFQESSYICFLLVISIPTWIIWMVGACFLPNAYHNACFGEF